MTKTELENAVRTLAGEVEKLGESLMVVLDDSISGRKAELAKLLNAAGSTNKTRYEYTHIDDGVSVETLDAYGKDGWRVVSALFRHEDRGYGQVDAVLLERRVSDEQAKEN